MTGARQPRPFGFLSRTPGSVNADLPSSQQAQYVRMELERHTATRGPMAVLGQFAILLLIVVTARRLAPILTWVSGIAVALLFQAGCQAWYTRRPHPPAVAARHQTS